MQPPLLRPLKKLKPLLKLLGQQKSKRGNQQKGKGPRVKSEREVQERGVEVQ